MNEQNRGSLNQMNLTLKNVTANLEMEPKERKAAYRLAKRLLWYTVNDAELHGLKSALGYENTDILSNDADSLAKAMIQVQRAFGESEVRGIWYEADDYTPPQDVPDWLKAEQEKWRRFELTCDNKAQVDNLNEVLANHNLSRQELAVIVASLRLRPEFTLADFRPNQSAANLSGYDTAQLVTELEQREGVETHRVDPYATFTLNTEGPAAVLVVID